MTSKEIRVACFENCPGEHSTTMKYYTTVASLSWIIQSIFQHREDNLDTRLGKSHENHLVVWECHKFFWWTAPRKNSIILFDLHTSKNFYEACMRTLHCQTCYVTWLNSGLLSCSNHSVFSHSLSNKYLKGLIQLTLRGKKFAMQLALVTVAS